jgi:hypothetical protein
MNFKIFMTNTEYIDLQPTIGFSNRLQKPKNLGSIVGETSKTSSKAQKSKYYVGEDPVTVAVGSLLVAGYIGFLATLFYAEVRDSKQYENAKAPAAHSLPEQH